MPEHCTRKHLAQKRVTQWKSQQQVLTKWSACAICPSITHTQRETHHNIVNKRNQSIATDAWTHLSHDDGHADLTPLPRQVDGRARRLQCRLGAQGNGLHFYQHDQKQ